HSYGKRGSKAEVDLPLAGLRPPLGGSLSCWRRRRFGVAALVSRLEILRVRFCFTKCFVDRQDLVWCRGFVLLLTFQIEQGGCRFSGRGCVCSTSRRSFELCRCFSTRGRSFAADHMADEQQA